MFFKFILHFRILSISLYMYDFSVRSRSVMGSACLSVYAILLSHDFTLRDIRIKEYIYWLLKSDSRGFRV